MTNWNIPEGKFVIMMCPREWGTISPYPVSIFCPENVVCFLHLQCISDKIFFMEANNINTDQTAPASHLQQIMIKYFLAQKNILAKTSGNIFFIPIFSHLY